MLEKDTCKISPYHLVASELIAVYAIACYIIISISIDVGDTFNIRMMYILGIIVNSMGLGYVYVRQWTVSQLAQP